MPFQWKGYREMGKYVCGICGYVYDPAEGDKEGKIPPGVPFNELPDEWVCRICGAGKEEFSPD
jgi:rubredoxin